MAVCTTLCGYCWTAGGWDDAAIETIRKCATTRVDVSRRCHVVGLWWQMLSVALQNEHERVLRSKVAACAGTSSSPYIVHEDVLRLTVLLQDFLNSFL